MKDHRQRGLALAIALTAAGCSDANTQKGANQRTPAVAAKTSDTGMATATSTSVDSDAPDEDTDAATASDGDALALFCTRGAETKVVEQWLSSYFSRFCAGGQPTELLSSSLIANAYGGVGGPELTQLGDWEEDKDAKTTAGTFAAAVKLPITIEDHFASVAPKTGDEANIKLGAERQGAVAEIVSVLQKHTSDGPHHVRGWTIETRLSKAISFVTLTTHAVTRSDQHVLAEGLAYLYSQHVLEAKETIKDFDMLTAGIKLGEDSYLVTVARVKIDNKGFHPIAIEAIKTTATETVRSLYTSALPDG